MRSPSRRLCPAARSRACRSATRCGCARPGPPLAGRELVAFVGEADALVCLLADRVAAEVFALCPRLKVVANYAVGVNNVDLEAARTSGVWVTNTPDVLTDATADLTWALILAVTRRVVEGDRLVRSGGFTGLEARSPAGRRACRARRWGSSAWAGSARAVARRAVGVRDDGCAYTRPGADAAGEAIGAEYVADLDELLARADVLSLHCPLTHQTRHLIDARRLRLLPRGAIVVNTSRGEVVDEAALVRGARGAGTSGAPGSTSTSASPRSTPACSGAGRGAAAAPRLGHQGDADGDGRPRRGQRPRGARGEPRRPRRWSRRWCRDA